jgi:uncharacterized membrane protein (GlpM family)
MLYYTLKVLVSALVIVAVSELSRRSSLFGGILASLPLTSILAMVWLYRDTGSKQAVEQLSTAIFWLVLPSLSLFLLLPVLMRRLSFGLAMTLSSATMVILYFATVFLLGRLGIKL